MKRLLISILLAGAITAGLLAAAQLPSGGPTVVSLVILPFYMVGVLGVLFSHNAHQPNEIASYSSMFLFFFLISFGGQLVWSRRRGATK